MLMDCMVPLLIKALLEGPTGGEIVLRLFLIRILYRSPPVTPVDVTWMTPLSEWSVEPSVCYSLRREIELTLTFGDACGRLRRRTSSRTLLGHPLSGRV